MAIVDYGTVVFKDGKQVQKDKRFGVLELGGIRFEFYKVWCEAYNSDGEVIASYINTNPVRLLGVEYAITDLSEWSVKKSSHFYISGIAANIKELLPRVFRFQTSYDGHYYTVVYGYGIDPDYKIWEQTKRIYHNKRSVEIIDRQIERAGGYADKRGGSA